MRQGSSDAPPLEQQMNEAPPVNGATADDTGSGIFANKSYETINKILTGHVNYSVDDETGNLLRELNNCELVGNEAIQIAEASRQANSTKKTEKSLGKKALRFMIYRLNEAAQQSVGG